MNKKEETKTAYKKSIAIRLDDELYQLAKKLALQKDRSVSWIIRDAIKESIKSALKK